MKIKTLSRAIFSRNTEKEFAKLLDDNPDLEAVFCVNDLSALGFYEELKRRKLRPGKDIYVLGYDNTLLGARSKPSLSSVWSDPVELGEKALYNVLKMLDGEKIESEVLPTKLIKRNSFGVISNYNINSAEALLNEASVWMHFDDIFYRYMHSDVVSEISQVRGLFGKIMNDINKVLNGENAVDEHNSALIDDIDAFINSGALEYADIDNLIMYLDQISEAIKSEKNEKIRFALLDAFDIFYCKIIFDMDHRFGVLRRDSEDTWFAMKMFVRDILQFERGNDLSYAVLLENLDWLDIKSAYVYTFKKTVTYLNGDTFTLPEKIYLKAKLSNGKAEAVSAKYQERNTVDIFNFGSDNSQYCMMMMPLFFNENLYGAVICDLTDRIFFDGEFLTNQMGSAVKIIKLLNTNEKIQSQLEGSLSALREHNIELDNLSKSDVLTGIYNRRGFYKAAGIFVEQSRKLDKHTIVAYVDMNNLKIINDRYGHDEGDYALRLIGDILSEIMNNNGIIGRIGGDEFAFVMEYSAEEKDKSLLNEIRSRFEQYNLESDKPYNITVSIGTYILKPEENIDLMEALTLADEQMYEMKKLRVKQVAKGETT